MLVFFRESRVTANESRAMEVGDRFKHGLILLTMKRLKGGRQQVFQTVKICVIGNFKNFLLLAFIAMFGFSAVAQDIIILKNGDEIKSFVQEVGIEYVKYKKFDNPTGPIYTKAIAEIFMIKYQNGSKDVFNEVTKTIETKPERPKQSYQEEAVKPVEKKDVSMPESTRVKSSENIETVHLVGQNRNDVIVTTARGWFMGFQGNITRTDYKYLYYEAYNREIRIKKKKVAFTLSFNEKFKQEKYPSEMSLQDFLSLPTYLIGAKNWVVFGTNGMSNLPQLYKTHPDIYNNFNKGIRQKNTGAVLTGIGVAFTGMLFVIPGLIVYSSGSRKINGTFTDYYRSCLDLEVCTKYGIIVTPYNTSLYFR